VVIYSYICTFVFYSLPFFVCIQKINSTMHTLQEVKESKGTSVSVYAFELIILDVQGHPSYIQIILYTFTVYTHQLDISNVVALNSPKLTL
jgi:hypothetical protein